MCGSSLVRVCREHLARLVTNVLSGKACTEAQHARTEQRVFKQPHLDITEEERKMATPL